jgi:hypothetical protein
MNAIQTSPKNDAVAPKQEKEQGKIGMAILLWLLGVPGGIVLLYLLLAR